jgi:hypothetical protein
MKEEAEAAVNWRKSFKLTSQCERARDLLCIPNHMRLRQTLLFGLQFKSMDAFFYA